MCYGQFATFRLTRAYFVHVLHMIEVANPVFLAPNRTFTGIFNYLPLYWGPNRSDSMLYYPFSCCGSIATLPEPQFLTEITSTSNQQKSQLWTFITLFLAGSGYTKLYESSYKLKLTCIYIIYPKFAPILRSQKKKVNFSCSGPTTSNPNIQIQVL